MTFEDLVDALSRRGLLARTTAIAADGVSVTLVATAEPEPVGDEKEQAKQLEALEHELTYGAS